MKECRALAGEQVQRLPVDAHHNLQRQQRRLEKRLRQRTQAQLGPAGVMGGNKAVTFLALIADQQGEFLTRRLEAEGVAAADRHKRADVEFLGSIVVQHTLPGFAAETGTR